MYIIFGQFLRSAVQGGNNFSRNLDHIVLPVEVQSEMAKEVDHGRNHSREQIDFLVDGSVINDFSTPENTKLVAGGGRRHH